MPKTVTSKPKVARKVVRAKKSVFDKINATVSKWDLSDHPDFVKVATPDFLSFLASTIENGQGLTYETDFGRVLVKPKRLKDLEGILKYLKRQAK